MLDTKPSHAQPSQHRQVCADPELFAQVPGDGADIRAFAAAHAKRHLFDLRVQRRLGHSDVIDAHRSRLLLDIGLQGGFFFAGQLTPSAVIQSLARHFQRREARRHLHHLAQLQAQGCLNLGQCQRRQLLLRGHHQLLMTRSRIIGIRHHAQPRRRQVLFVGVLQIRHQLGRLAQAQHQHPGGHRVQRTGMTHALFAGGPAHLRHHVKRSQTLRLIEDKDTVHMRRTVAAAAR